MYRSRLFTVVTFAGVLGLGTAAATQCGPSGSVSPPPSSTTVVSTTTVPPVPGVDPTLTIGDLRIREGDVGQVVAAIPVTLDRPAAARYTLQYRIAGGTATPGEDFAAPPSGVIVGNATVFAGTTSTSVSVTVLDDTVPEADDTVAIDILSAPGLVLGRTHGVLTIVDNDVAPTARRSGAATSALLVSAAPTLSVGAPTVWEGDLGARTAAVPVTLSEPAPAPVTVVLNSDGTLPDDWRNANLSCQEFNQLRVPPLSTTVTFATGEQSKQAIVQVNGNVQPDQLATGVVSSATVVSGQAIVDLAFPATVVDDDTANTNVSPPPPGTYRVSEPSDGSDPTFPLAVADDAIGCGYPSSRGGSVTPDGRYVLFSSNADNLVGNDINGADDAFVKDTWTGAIERVNVAADGSQANDGFANAESISANGRYVTFFSDATNLVADGDSGPDSFLKDRVTGAVVRLGGVTGPGGTSQSFIGADNRSVVFASDVPLDGSQCTTPSCTNQVYLYDVVTGTYTLISAGFTGADNPVISNDGKHVAFVGWMGTDAQVYVKDLETGDVEMVSVNNAGEPGRGVYGTYTLNQPAISADGRIVAFAGQYCNTGLPSTPCGDGTIAYTEEIWVRDRAAGTLTLGSVMPTGTPARESFGEASLSADGHYLAYSGTNPDPTSECSQGVFLRDLVAGTTEQVSTDPCRVGAAVRSTQAMTPDAASIIYMALQNSAEHVSPTNPESVYMTKRN